MSDVLSPKALGNGRSLDRDAKSLFFVFLLWGSLFFGIVVLLVLITSTAIQGASRLDSNLLTNYFSQIAPAKTGFRAAILGSLWLMIVTALLSVPLGIAAAIYLEEFADNEKWYNRLLELNLQNLAAVPSVIYGLLAVVVLTFFGIKRTGTIFGGAVALTLLILPVIIITTREALRSVPQEIRHGSLALGATVWQTSWRQTLPSAIPGIATGTILGLSRAIGEAAPLLLLGVAVGIRFDPSGLGSQFTALPIQIFNMVNMPQPEFKVAAAAAIIVLLAMVLLLNGLAIFIRNRFQRRW